MTKNCIQCNHQLISLGFGWYSHPPARDWRMPMDGYLPEHWTLVECSEYGNIQKLS